ncbi:hypothetical protein E4U54_005741, partial [Claviceps lovelessii]
MYQLASIVGRKTSDRERRERRPTTIEPISPAALLAFKLKSATHRRGAWICDVVARPWPPPLLLSRLRHGIVFKDRPASRNMPVDRCWTESGGTGTGTTAQQIPDSRIQSLQQAPRPRDRYSGPFGRAQMPSHVAANGQGLIQVRSPENSAPDGLTASGRLVLKI